MIIDLPQVITEMNAQVHEPISGSNTTILNEQRIRRLELRRCDTIECSFEVGDSWTYLSPQLIAR